MGFFDRLFGKRAEALAPAQASSLDGHPVALAFAAADRKLAVLTGEGALAVLDVASGATGSARNADPRGALALAVDEGSGRIATSGMDGVVRVIDATSGAIEREASLERGVWIEHLAWWGTTLVAAHGKRVSLVSPDGATRSLGAHQSTVASVSIAQDLLAVARFGGADVWSLNEPEREPRHLEWPSSLVSIAWSPDARFLAAGCQDSAIHFWRWPAGTDSMMGGYPGKPKVIAWSPSTHLLATGGGEDIVVWSFRGEGPEGTTPLQLRAHAKPISALAWSADGKLLASGGRDGLLCVWRAGTEDAPLARLQMGGGVESLAFSHDGAWLAAASSSGLVQIVRR